MQVDRSDWPQNSLGKWILDIVNSGARLAGRGTKDLMFVIGI